MTLETLPARLPGRIAQPDLPIQAWRVSLIRTFSRPSLLPQSVSWVRPSMHRNAAAPPWNFPKRWRQAEFKAESSSLRSWAGRQAAGWLSSIAQRALRNRWRMATATARGSAGELECQARLASTHYVSTHNNRDFHEKILKNPMIFYFSHFFSMLKKFVKFQRLLVTWVVTHAELTEKN